MKKCFLCEKKRMKGHLRCYSNKASRRFWKLNLQKRKITILDEKEEFKRTMRVMICTRCTKTIKVWQTPNTATE